MKKKNEKKKENGFLKYVEKYIEKLIKIETQKNKKKVLNRRVERIWKYKR